MLTQKIYLCNFLMKQDMQEIVINIPFFKKNARSVKYREKCILRNIK